MKIKSQRDFASGILFLAIGVAFAVGATTYSFGNSARPGPGYFPLLLGIILALLGAIVLFTSLTIESEGGDPIGALTFKPLLLVLGAVVLFGVTLPYLGLVVAAPLMIVVSCLAGDEFHWGEALILCVVLTLFSWLVFSKGLGLTIPMLPAAFG
ncbi:MAG TPA: tripartite tricarboxylate transporter TctB family protein [Burkholderiaceae bacterium]|nr:tripartite tricarboxylate transporter TctB family protein [Burkholderiaceae bacterium]